MSDMPERIWAYRKFDEKKWSLNERPHHHNRSPSLVKTPYIRADIAKSLYDALKMACMQDCGWAMHAQAAIEAYRKAKGE